MVHIAHQNVYPPFNGLIASPGTHLCAPGHGGHGGHWEKGGRGPRPPARRGFDARCEQTVVRCLIIRRDSDNVTCTLFSAFVCSVNAIKKSIL